MNSVNIDSSDPFVSTQTILPYSYGILKGMSFAVKDNIDIKNQPTGYGSPGWVETHDTPVVNAICIEQLLCEGGIFKGKTKSDELAYSLMGVNSFYGTPINSKAPDRIPGGSSSGSASAVAGGRVDFAMGTDTGGSIRVPASNCGVWGYRPSHGIISVAGVLPLAPSFDTVGIISQNGQILEKVMQVLLAQDMSRHRDVPTICFIDDIFKISDQTIEQASRTIQNKIICNFKTQTLTLAEITAFNSDFNALFLQLGFLLSTEIWNTFGSWVKTKRPKLSAAVEFSLCDYAESASRNDIQNMLSAQKKFQNNLNKFLCAGNVLCFPTTVDLSPRLDQITPDFLDGDYVPKAMGVNAVSSLSCTPQITIPIPEAKGIPVGLSFVAGYGQDMMLADLCNTIYDQCLGDV
ncbi:MAG: glutamyl-tRNA amidotransferase [Desulfobacter sp.]|nr:glutamyl-tRNA amidotransferase [Desulfobacter sp.]